MTYVFIAYSIIWVALLAYSLTLSQRQKQLVTELERLEKAVNNGRSVPQ
jgi:CcmD family protein